MNFVIEFWTVALVVQARASRKSSWSHAAAFPDSNQYATETDGLFFHHGWRMKSHYGFPKIRSIRQMSKLVVGVL